jgi:hypothetical protein
VKGKPAPERYLTAIADAMPEPGLSIKTARRSAGIGSLGRPKWVGSADWRGAPIVREAKALVESAWSRAHRLSNRGVRVGEIANGRFRPLDPWYRIKDNVVVRRLSPNNRRAQEYKRAFPHLVVFFGKILLKNVTMELLSQPVFVLACGFADSCHRSSTCRRDTTAGI